MGGGVDTVLELGEEVRAGSTETHTRHPLRRANSVLMFWEKESSAGCCNDCSSVCWVGVRKVTWSRR